MTLKLLLLPRAESDLDECFEYLALEAGIETALRFEEAVFSTFYRLAETPFIGAARDDLIVRDISIRMWFIREFDKYIVFYRIHSGSLEIVRVLHSSLDIENILADERLD